MHEHETLYDVLVVAALWFFSLIAHNYNDIAHGVMATISIAYLSFKFYRDYKRYKKTKGL